MSMGLGSGGPRGGPGYVAGDGSRLQAPPAAPAGSRYGSTPSAGSGYQAGGGGGSMMPPGSRGGYGGQPSASSASSGSGMGSGGQPPPPGAGVGSLGMGMGGGPPPQGTYGSGAGMAVGGPPQDSRGYPPSAGGGGTGMGGASQGSRGSSGYNAAPPPPPPGVPSAPGPTQSGAYGGAFGGASGDTAYVGRYAAGPTPEQYDVAKASQQKERAQLSLRTAFGPVPFRAKRQKLQIVLSGKQETVTIQKNWLKNKAQQLGDYQRSVKQSMLIAANNLTIFDGEDPYTKVSQAQLQVSRDRVAKLLRGHEQIAVSGSLKKSLHAIVNKENMPRETMVKFSKNCCVAGCASGCRRRERAFIIHNGELLVYKYKTKDSRLKMSYNLKDATCWHETRSNAQVPKWDQNFQERLRVDVPERLAARKNPLYLYSDDKTKIQRWKRAFTLAKALVSENDRRALKASIGRATSQGLMKAWEALVKYYREVVTTHDLVKQMAMRLTKVDLSRGWSKFKLVHKKRVEDNKRRMEHQILAARFLSERLAKLGSTNARSAQEVREFVITRIQQRFRRYRQDAIWAARYPLNASHISRVQQAKLGKAVDFQMWACSREDAVRLCMTPKGMKKWEEEKDFLSSLRPKATYSEADEPLSKVTLYVSDNLASLSFTPTFSKAAEMTGMGALQKADWSKYINLDRVSSIVLHADPPQSNSFVGVDDGGKNPCWLRINGPRLSWDRRLHRDMQGKVTVRGAEDAYSVPAKLAQQAGVRWLTLRVSQVHGSISNLTDDAGEPKSFARIHFLGYSFKSEVAQGRTPEYRFLAPGGSASTGSKAARVEMPPQASVPVASENFSVPSSSEIAVEIFQVHDVLPDKTSPAETNDERFELRQMGRQSLAYIFGDDLAMSLQSHPATDAKITLGHAPYGDTRDELLHGHFDFHIEMSLTAKEEKFSPATATQIGPQGDLCQVVSPEFVGGGTVTSLFTSHRQAWYDPELGPGKFRIDHVANFVELTLGSLRLPPVDKKVDKTASKKVYTVSATSLGCGVTQESIGLHRPSENWAKIIGQTYGDQSAVRFSGCKLFLPLAPGCWGNGTDDEAASMRRKIQITVWESEPELESKSTDFKQFFQDSVDAFASGSQDDRGKKALIEMAEKRKPKPVYQATIFFDSQVIVDRVKNLSIYLEKVDPAKTATTAELNVHLNMMSDGYKGAEDPSQECALNVDFALRDRDYVKGSLGEMQNRRALCVGDKAILTVREPLVYPKDAKEHQKRFFPGEWTQHGAKDWEEHGCKLREPCLSSEYSESGLGDVVPKVLFTQKFIPSMCENVVPHRFVLPVTEKQHIDRGLPGFYSKIIEDIAGSEHHSFWHHAHQQSRSTTMGASVGLNKPIVDHLRELSTKVAVTLLAMYADGTCDIEVDSRFIQNWSKSTNTKYVMPGYTEVTPTAPASKKLPRFVLKKVPTSHLQAVHYSGINMYDTHFKSVKDVLAADAPDADFDPTAFEAHKMMKDGRRYTLSAGPMPPDASVGACEYEWSIAVRSPSEYEMYQLASILRRCSRMDHFQQALKIKEFLSKAADGPALLQQQFIQRPIAGGQLDIVLVEARRLMPRRGGVAARVMNSDPSTMTYDAVMNPKGIPIRTERDIDEYYLPNMIGTTDGDIASSTPVGTALSVFVNFRMLERNGQILAYRGQKVQKSAILSGTDSPNWSSVSELRNSGGWTFKTGIIDPDKHPDLGIEFDVRSAFMGSSSQIGWTFVPVTTRRFLINPQEPFRNFWLPLVSTKDGKGVPNPTGEIHIMTRWLPAEMIQIMADGSQKQQMSVRSMFLKELWPRIVSQRLKEPVYNLECHYLHYNPNNIKDIEAQNRTAEAPKDHIRRHAEQLAHTTAYVECLERRQTEAWKEFDTEMDEEQPGLRLAERRLMWLESQNVSRLERFSRLLQQGIPSAMRERMWSEITLASRVLERDGTGAQGGGASRLEEGEAAIRAAEQDYQRYLESGLGMTSDGTKQLAEDAVNMAAWESATPPLPEVFDLHLQRIKRAQNVILALLAVPDSSIAYCESLLVLAFYMLLPQGYKEEKSTGDGTYHHFKESSVFWMLYTLICTRMNGAYRDYYGIVNSEDQEKTTLNVSTTLNSGSGAMQDIWLLDCCLAYHEHALWSRFTQLGFQLSTVFYGAFMRLFATYMPTATVFRFWDVLFAQSTEPNAQPNARVHLIDLAFGVLRSRRVDLMACESAHEVKTLILGALGSLYDTCTVVDITIVSHTFLWAGGGYSSAKVCQLFTQRMELFSSANSTASAQNEVLKQLMHLTTIRPNQPAALQQQQLQSAGVSTEDVRKQVMTVMTQSLQNMTKGEAVTWGMFRPMPLANRVVSAKMVDKYWQQFQQSLRTMPVLPPNPFRVAPTPPAAGRPKLTVGLEPRDVTTGDLANTLEREPNLRPWAPHATAIWNAFTNRRDRLQLLSAGLGYYDAYQTQPGAGDPNSNATQPLMTMPGAKPTMYQSVMGKLFGVADADPQSFGTGPLGSIGSHNDNRDGEQFSLNEFFIALLCSSRGTVGEKANALFNIYCYSEQRASQETKHLVPVSKLAKSFSMQNAEGSSDALGRTLAPPLPASLEALNGNCLRFEVWTDWPSKTCMGHVFIPSLSPYVSFVRDQAGAAPLSYNIWGKSTRAGRGKARGTAVASGSAQPKSASELVCLGEICMGIAWMPMSIRRPEEGQLSIHIHHIKFADMYVSDFYKINPWVEVSICSELGHNERSSVQGASRDWKPIKRWDPRGLIGNSQHRSKLVTHGAFGGHIKFDKTMVGSMVTGSDAFHGYMRDSKGMGWNKNDKTWEWNEVWGKQLSSEGQKVLPEFVKLSQRQNCMDMQGVRLIVSGILQQCMLNYTNRQACLLADSIFNRQGAVPGILKVIVVPGNLTAHTTLANLEKNCTEQKIPFKDLTHEVVIEQENQISRNGCTLNLFAKCWLGMPPGADGHAGYLKYGFKDMQLSDPFPNQEKVMWIRYVRGGDGERLTHAVKFDQDGNLVGPDGQGYDPEVELEQNDVFPQTKVTREEFISCLVGNPILGESLRRLGSCEQVVHTPTAIPLEVAIMDPHQEEEDEAIADVLDVQQSILLEVWDSDTMGKDFLGEAWLPVLSTFSKRPKDLVLPLDKADYSDDADRGPSREDPRKEIQGDDNDPNKKVSGQLFVSVSWDYPIYKELSLHTDLHEWLEEELKIPNKTLTQGPFKGKTRVDAISERFRDLKTLSDERVNADGSLDKKFTNDEVPGWDSKELATLNKFFKEHTDKEDVRDRAAIQEKLHTGHLTIRIKEARMLRRADAKKLRDCDPAVHVWIRNDHQQAWRKKPIFRTKAISNNRNPKWDVVFEKDILTGLYEARYKLPEEGWMAEVKKVMRSRKEQRHMDEDRTTAMVKRYGQDGLRVKFSETSQQGPGENHKVQVLMSDTIHEFKAKLTTALAKESQFWRGKDDQMASRYSDVKISYKHLVMVFIPSAKVQKLRAQRMAEGEEYKRAFAMAIEDPSNWQPLDPARSFSHYSQFAFGRQQAQPLRIVEATEAYKAQNLRYKLYEEEINKKGWQDINNTRQCFGWAKYRHQDDNSYEWRPSILSRTDEEMQKPNAAPGLDPAKTPYTARLIFETSTLETEKSGTSVVVKEVPVKPLSLARAEVLIAPRIPKFEDQVDPAHLEFLEQARMLRQSGKSDWEIETVLNKLLKDKYESQKKADASFREPAQLTVDEIRMYLQREETKEAEKMDKSTHGKAGK